MARAKGIVLLGVIGSGEQLAWWSATSLLAKRLPAAAQLMQAVEPVLPGVLCNAFSCRRRCPTLCPLSSGEFPCRHLLAGTYGRVYRAQYRGRTVAIKILDLHDADKRVRGADGRGFSTAGAHAHQWSGLLPHANACAGTCLMAASFLTARCVSEHLQHARQATQQSACVYTLAGRGAGHPRMPIPDGVPSPVHHRVPHIL